MLSRSVRAASRAALATPLRRPAAVAPRQLAPAVSVTATRAYHEKVLDHYSKPRNVGTLKGTDVGSGLVGAPACGDVMKINIRVDPTTNTIAEAKFKTFGCGSAIASSSYLTELVKGMTLDEANRIKNTDIAGELKLPPVKLHCSMLAEDGIKAAIADYYTKNPNAKVTNLAGTAKAAPTAEAAAPAAAASA